MTLIGWCPGSLSVKDTLTAYPGTRTVRLFRGLDDDLPPWDSTLLGPVLGAGAVPHLSFKRWEPPRLLQWLDAMPARWLDTAPGRLALILTYGHEPEQQTGGDPPPATFRARYLDLVTSLAGHPARPQMLLVPVFTLHRWEVRGDGRQYWPAEAAHGIDAVGWDAYSKLRDRYRDPAEMLTLPREFSREVDRPYLLAELGAERVPGDDGRGCAQWLDDVVDVARADRAVTVAWFHYGGDDLLRHNRIVEQQTLRDLIAQEPEMTRAPASLLAVRRLLVDHLNIDKDTVRADDLEPAEVGIVGDPAHRGGYHCGSDRVVTDDYSVVESSRDRAGLTLDAAALDIGLFEVTVGGVTHNLFTFNRWMVAQLEAGTPDSQDIREWIYTLDGKTVRRWDRLRRRSTGDRTHLWHSHGSWFRDAIKAGRDLTPLFRRYLTEIGLLEDELTRTEFIEHFKAALGDPTVASIMRARPWQYPVTPTASALTVLFGQQLPQLTASVQALGEVVARESASPDEVRAALAALPAPVPVDVVALADELAARVREALPDSGAVTDEQLARVLRGVLGSLDDQGAAETVGSPAELLSAGTGDHG